MHDDDCFFAAMVFSCFLDLYVREESLIEDLVDWSFVKIRGAVQRVPYLSCGGILLVGGKRDGVQVVALEQCTSYLICTSCETRSADATSVILTCMLIVNIGAARGRNRE